MSNNPYPIQIKKRILFDLVYKFVWIVAIFLVITIFFSTLAAYAIIIISILTIIRIIWLLLYLKSIDYSLDNINFILKAGVISRSEKTLPYKKIQHVIIYESFWQRVLGLSSVSIETARESANINEDQNMIQRTGPFIPDLNKKDAEKLRNYIISVSNNKYKSIAGI